MTRPARLEIDAEGRVIFDGKVHIPTPEGVAASRAKSPEFFDALTAIGMLIRAVDDEEWKQMAAQQLIRFLDAMHGEVFSSCCPTCQAIVDATFQDAAGVS